MTTTLMNYTTRQNVENFLGQPFPAISNDEFNNYLLATEAFINNYTGYNAETTTSGMLYEHISMERTVGKIDNYGNLTVALMKPPMAFDLSGNPKVELLQYEFGGIRVPLQLTDGTANALNTLLDVSENRRSVIYPSIYFLPYLPSVTPTAKMNLYNLRDTKFWVTTTYYGGYPVLPFDVVQAANLICGNMVLQRKNPQFAQGFRQGSFQMEFYSRTSGNANGHSENKAIAAAQELLDPYVRYTW